MTRVLYISNIEVPYRTEYFNQLSKKVDLTVIYERKKSSNRDKGWTSSIESKYKIKYLKGIPYKGEYVISLGIIKYIFSKKYDEIIIGCINSPTQIIATLLLKLFKKNYILNLDGEYFFDGDNIKKRVKRFIIRGASKYFVAGEFPKENLKRYIDEKKLFTYHFSSLTKNELNANSQNINKNINNSILVIGQFLEYKGLDIALEVAKIDSKNKYIFIGSGNRSNLLTERVKTMKLTNVSVVPFLKKEDLYAQYKNSKLVLLPSRKECWGLVINEAASFGCPIISSDGSGAANEILEKQWLVKSGDYINMYKKIQMFEKGKYDKKALIEKVKDYSIEQMVDDTLNMLD